MLQRLFKTGQRAGRVILSTAGISIFATGSAWADSEFFIGEFEVRGVHHLDPIEVERAVYPFLGPYRRVEDVEAARQALEEAYRERGYLTVAVSIPPQEVEGGVIRLEVTEMPVGRLRVRGSRYFDLERIKSAAPSMAEGTVIDFDAVRRDLVALNRFADRRIAPALLPGAEPDTVDIVLEVEDTRPLHGGVELNNRKSSNTTDLRFNASLSYHNLWQLNHVLGGSYQVAPEEPEESAVYAAFYLLPIPGWSSTSFMLQGSKQDSNVSTIGGAAVAGKGDQAGWRLLWQLPPRPPFQHSASFGMDYKRFLQKVTFGGETTEIPVSYYPFSADYNAAYFGKDYQLQGEAGVVFSARGMGSDTFTFDQNRFDADGGFLVLRAALGLTRELPWGWEIFGRVHGGASGQPLLTNEQIAGGGLGTVRGYLEAEALGDQAGGGALELRTPNLIGAWLPEPSSMRLYAFAEGMHLYQTKTLPEQRSSFDLASAGTGGSLFLGEHLRGGIDIAWPILSEEFTKRGDVRLLFRVGGDF